MPPKKTVGSAVSRVEPAQVSRVSEHSKRIKKVSKQITILKQLLKEKERELDKLFDYEEDESDSSNVASSDEENK